MVLALLHLSVPQMLALNADDCPQYSLKSSMMYADGMRLAQLLANSLVEKKIKNCYFMLN
jgi:hypothetical protein